MELKGLTPVPSYGENGRWIANAYYVDENNNRVDDDTVRRIFDEYFSQSWGDSKSDKRLLLTKTLK
jgi:tryptophanase